MELSAAASDLLGQMESRVLASLARLAEPVTGRHLARLAGFDPSTVYRYLKRLVAIGLVRATKTPSAIMYSLNRAHVYWQPLEDILASPARIEREIAERVRELVGDSARVAVFGSVASGRATAESDFDLLLIPDESVSRAKREQLVHELHELIENLTGNPAQIIDVSTEEIRDLAASGAPIAIEWKQHARPLDGRGRLRWGERG